VNQIVNQLTNVLNRIRIYIQFVFSKPVTDNVPYKNKTYNSGRLKSDTIPMNVLTITH